jgi:O-antigen biosynthesis protein
MTAADPRPEAPWLPLISCVMVTRGRPAFVRQSIAYFLAQDYPHLELVIVYEEDGDLPEPMPELPRGGPRVRCRRVVPGLHLGAKRNVGVAEAHGELIAQWDDDDWYATARVRRQAEPILAGTADITALRVHRFFELGAWKLWTCSSALHARMFAEDVAGGTLVYRRELWGRDARYPATNLREDADFLAATLRAGARLHRIIDDGDGEELFVYVRHGANTWSFASGTFMTPADWREVGEPTWPDELLSFYRAQASHRLEVTRPGAARLVGAPSRPPPRRSRVARPGQELPRVACIMPTGDRPELVARALRHFQRQRYPHRELIVIDDGDRPVGPLLPRDDRIRYLRLDAKLPLGTKRNLACEAADAEVIVHWDDDDWMAPGWIDAQVHALRDADADATGLGQVYFYAPAAHRAWRYVYPSHGRPWVHGATLCYTRAFWQRNPFAPVTIGEDLRFLWSGSAHRIVPHERSDLFVSYVHAANTSPKRFISSRWRACPVEVIDRLMVASGEEQPASASPHLR